MNGLILIGASVVLSLVDKYLNTPTKIKDVVVENGRLTSKYLVERIRNGNQVHIHRGIDIAAKIGSRVRAVNDGTVFVLWPNGKVKGYGNTIIIKHIDGTASLYGHLDKWVPFLNVGDKIMKGQIIGFVGNTESGTTGRPMSPHLHLEVHEKAVKNVNPDNPKRINPEDYLKTVGMKIS